MIAKLLPAKIRLAIYSVLSAAFLIEAIWDVVPAGVETRVMQTLAVLGFGLAAGNVDTGKGDA